MNPRLAPMNTQARTFRLEAGQAFSPSRRITGPAVLTEGEVQVQEPARWLAGQVIVSAPVRLAAPAVLPAESAGSIIAVSASTVMVAEEAPLLSNALGAVLSWLRAPAGFTLPRATPAGTSPFAPKTRVTARKDSRTPIPRPTP